MFHGIPQDTDQLMTSWPVALRPNGTSHLPGKWVPQVLGLTQANQEGDLAGAMLCGVKNKNKKNKNQPTNLMIS